MACTRTSWCRAVFLRYGSSTQGYLRAYNNSGQSECERGTLSSALTFSGSDEYHYLGSGRMEVQGNIFCAGWNTQFHHAGGSYSRPAYSFYSDTDTGLYRTQSNQCGIAAGGVLSAFFGQSTVAFPRTPGFTTGWSANMYISGTSTGSGGFVYRSTSSARYKADITALLEPASGVLDLAPSTYTGSTSDPVTGEPVFGGTHLGLIAEDVDTHLPLACIYDEDGQPDAIDWNAITAAILSVVKDLETRLAVTEALLKVAPK